MSTDNPNPAEPVEPTPAPPVGASPGTSAPQPSGDTGEWQSKYKGMQTAYNKLFKENEKAQETLTGLQARVEELTASIKSRDGEKGAMQKQLGELTTLVDALTGERNQLQSKQERTNLILTEFPELSLFEARGLLPPAPDAESLRTLLGGFRELMGSQVREGLEQKLSGATPAVPASRDGKEVTPSTDDLYEKLIRLAGSSRPDDQKLYRELQSQYDALVDAQQS